MRSFSVYLLRCGDGSYYAGHTDDLDARMIQHHDGLIGYTATRKPVELVWQGEFEKRESALAFEQQIKGWSRAKKEALIAGDWNRVRELAQSKGSPRLHEKFSIRVEPFNSVQDRLVEAPRALRQAQGERCGVQSERRGT